MKTFSDSDYKMTIDGVEYITTPELDVLPLMWAFLLMPMVIPVLLYTTMVGF